MDERLSRKDLKQDEFVEAVERSTSFVEEHSRTLIAIGIAVVVAVVAGFGIHWWLGQQEEAAGAALNDALKVARAPVGPDAGPAEEGGETFADEATRRARAKELFTAVADDYGMTDAADVADVYLAQIAVEEGDTARARELWEGFVDDHGDHVLAGQARVNVLHLDRQEGRAEEVVAELEPMLEAAPGEAALPADVVLWELAQTYDEMDRAQDAEDTYRRLAEEYPGSPYAGQARQRLPQEAPAGNPMLGGAAMPGFGG